MTAVGHQKESLQKMERVAQYLSHYSCISEEAKAYLFESGKIKHYKKGDYYLRIGDVKLVSGFLLERLISYEFVNKIDVGNGK